jgi:IclR family pca regulon transcriptional regulator
VFDDYLARAQFQAITPFSIKDPARLVAAVRVIRRQSWAVNDQETVLGLRSVAVPISLDGQIIAALGASTEVARTTVQHMTEQFVPALQRASSFVSDLLSQVEPRRRWR